MDRASKTAAVELVRERIERAPAIYLTDFSGLDVKSMTTLRRELKQSGGEYVVAKNRLVKLSIAGTRIPDIGAGLTGPTGLVFGYEDAVATAKALQDFAARHNNRPVLKLGVLDANLVTPEEVEAIAKLPPRDVLFAHVAGVLQGPLAALAAALEGKLRETVGLLEALAARQGGSGDQE